MPVFDEGDTAAPPQDVSSPLPVARLWSRPRMPRLGTGLCLGVGALGPEVRQHVREHFLTDRHLVEYAKLLEHVSQP